MSGRDQNGLSMMAKVSKYSAPTWGAAGERAEAFFRAIHVFAIASRGPESIAGADSASII